MACLRLFCVVLCMCFLIIPTTEAGAISKAIKMTPELRKKYFSESSNLKKKVLYRNPGSNKFADKRQRNQQKKPTSKKMKNVKWEDYDDEF